MQPYEVLWEAQDVSGTTEIWMILRFIAPEIAREGGSVAYEVAVEDLDHICTEIGLPLVATFGFAVDQVVVTLMDFPVARGQAAPEITQYRAAYAIADETCLWQ